MVCHFCTSNSSSVINIYYDCPLRLTGRPSWSICDVFSQSWPTDRQEFPTLGATHWNHLKFGPVHRQVEFVQNVERLSNSAPRLYIAIFERYVFMKKKKIWTWNKLFQKRNAKLVNYEKSVYCASFYCLVDVHLFQKVIEHFISINHSVVTTSCLSLGLFITQHILPKIQTCPAH